MNVAVVCISMYTLSKRFACAFTALGTIEL